MKNGDWTLRRSFFNLSKIITGSYIWMKQYSQRKLSKVQNIQLTDNHFVYPRPNYNSQLKLSFLPYLKRKELNTIRSLISPSLPKSSLIMQSILDKEINFKEWQYSWTTFQYIRPRMYRGSSRSILFHVYSTYHISQISILVNPASRKSRTIISVRNLNAL